MRILFLLAILIAEITTAATYVPSRLYGRLQQKVAGTGSAAEYQLTLPPHPQNRPQPIKTGQAALGLGAKAAIAIDVATSQPLFTQNADAPLPIASITKVMTALVILKYHNLAEPVTIDRLPAYPEGAQLLGVVPGQRFSVGELLKAALIESDNDAADALALHDTGSLAAFSRKMNRHARLWSLDNLHFDNANGLGDGSRASARDLAKLGRLAVLNPQIAALVATSEATVTAADGQTYAVTNTNELLPDGRFYGIKTGYTEAAGQSFLGLTKIAGRPVITVVLNSPDRFEETRRLADWIQENYTWQQHH